ncbi:MAG: M20/M25/M40 family metallo-hydrolase [Gemmatimonadaceae bacterium]
MMLASPAASQRRAVDAIATWIALDAPTGREHHASDIIRRELPGWTRDAMGNLIMRRGSGSPRRVVACPLDQASYVVSAITPNGYLRLHGAGNARRHALWDQFHEGQRVRVVTAAGAVQGVIAVRSVHLWRLRDADTSIASPDDLWLDIGARTAAEVRARGVAMLDPVVREWPPWRYGEFVAGPGAAARAACAAVAAASRLTPTRGETVYILGAQSAFNHVGLSAALAALGSADTVTLVDPNVGVTDTTEATPSRRAAPLPFRVPAGTRIGATMMLGLRPAFRGTLAESVQEGDARVLLGEVLESAGVAADAAWPALRGTTPMAPFPTPRDSLAPVADLLSRLSDEYGVSGHEAPVRDMVREALPAWARALARVDTAGNLIVAVGPDRDTVVFVAHLDEIGLEVTAISADGQVSLRQRGGFFRSLFEGQPALLHRAARGDDTTRFLRGVFVPRRTVTGKQPAEVTAWFGLDSAALVARGVAVGRSLTSWKRATRLGRSRFTARSIDDRAGTTALVLALSRIDRTRLPRKVIFLWSTREETGLSGAAAAAATFGPTIRRVYAVDTFVSADSPLESSRFAVAPVGRGAVLRALDNSSATPPAEVDRVVQIARRTGIPVQVGTTNGGNDGSAFSRYGAIDIPIAWPLRYSHSPAELIDLGDVHALARLVAALARN